MIGNRQEQKMFRLILLVKENVLYTTSSRCGSKVKIKVGVRDLVHIRVQSVKDMIDSAFKYGNIYFQRSKF